MLSSYFLQDGRILSINPPTSHLSFNSSRSFWLNSPGLPILVIKYSLVCSQYIILIYSMCKILQSRYWRRESSERYKHRYVCAMYVGKKYVRRASGRLQFSDECTGDQLGITQNNSMQTNDGAMSVQRFFLFWKTQLKSFVLILNEFILLKTQKLNNIFICNTNKYTVTKTIIKNTVLYGYPFYKLYGIFF